jgi:hypothetical protein
MTLLMLTEAISSLVSVNVPALSLAGFQMTLIGRFWVTTEAKCCNTGNQEGPPKKIGIKKCAARSKDAFSVVATTVSGRL